MLRSSCYDRYIYTYISDKFHKIEFDPSLIKIATLDIECESENAFSRTNAGNRESKCNINQTICKSCVVFGIVMQTESDVVYYECSNEQDLLMKFVKYWREECLILSQDANVNHFDITYLCNRLDRLFCEDTHKKLSPWGMSNVREFTNYVIKRIKYLI